ncbi:MAG: hypothetical protein WC526_02575 [Patescibacteria group bacterium]
MKTRDCNGQRIYEGSIVCDQEKDRTAEVQTLLDEQYVSIRFYEPGSELGMQSVVVPADKLLLLLE